MNNSLSDLDLIRLQVETLFIHDQHGRIRANNEPGHPPAPQLFLGMTKEGTIWRFRHDLPDHAVRALEPLLESIPVISAVHSGWINAPGICAALQSYCAISMIWNGPAYYFPTDLQSSADVVLITERNKELLQAGFASAQAQLEAHQPCLAVVENGAAVAICFSARISAHAAEAGIETLASFRRRGYAARTVASWATAVRNLGRLPLYSTSWNNLASQSVAQKLKLIPYGIDLSFI